MNLNNATTHPNGKIQPVDSSKSHGAYTLRSGRYTKEFKTPLTYKITFVVGLILTVGAFFTGFIFSGILIPGGIVALLTPYLGKPLAGVCTLIGSIALAALGGYLMVIGGRPSADADRKFIEETDKFIKVEKAKFAAEKAKDLQDLRKLLKKQKKVDNNGNIKFEFSINHPHTKVTSIYTYVLNKQNKLLLIKLNGNYDVSRRPRHSALDIYKRMLQHFSPQTK